MEQNQQRKQGGRYSAESKRGTLDLLRRSGKSMSQVGRELAVPACTVKWWSDQERKSTAAKSSKPWKVKARA
jgi:transposase-like protein